MVSLVQVVLVLELCRLGRFFFGFEKYFAFVDVVLGLRLIRTLLRVIPVA